MRTFSPHFERAGTHFCSHQFDHFAGRKTELLADGIKAGSVLPCHHDDPVNVSGRKIFVLHLGSSRFEGIVRKASGNVFDGKASSRNVELLPIVNPLM